MGVGKRFWGGRLKGMGGGIGSFFNAADARGEYPPCEPPKSVLINVTSGD